MTINGSNQAICKKKMWLKKRHAKKPQEDKSFSAVTASLLVQSFLQSAPLGGDGPATSPRNKTLLPALGRALHFLYQRQGKPHGIISNPFPSLVPHRFYSGKALRGDTPQCPLSPVAFIHALDEHLRNGQGKLILGQNKGKWFSGTWF